LAKGGEGVAADFKAGEELEVLLFQAIRFMIQLFGFTSRGANYPFRGIMNPKSRLF
jgi:hypothetical protein